MRLSKSRKVSVQPLFVLLYAVNVLTCITWLHPISSPSHLHSLTRPTLISGYSPLSLPAPRNFILSVSSTFVSLFQALPNQSQNLIRYLRLSFSASLLVAHLICHHCPHTDTGPLSCFPFQFCTHSLLVIFLSQMFVLSVFALSQHSCALKELSHSRKIIAIAVCTKTYKCQRFKSQAHSQIKLGLIFTRMAKVLYLTQILLSIKSM